MEIGDRVVLRDAFVSYKSPQGTISRIEGEIVDVQGETLHIHTKQFETIRWSPADGGFIESPVRYAASVLIRRGVLILEDITLEVENTMLHLTVEEAQIELLIRYIGWLSEGG